MDKIRVKIQMYQQSIRDDIHVTDASNIFVDDLNTLAEDSLMLDTSLLKRKPTSLDLSLCSL